MLPTHSPIIVMTYTVMAKVVEMGTGHYSVTYTLDSPGQYEMAVLVNKHPIADSPFTLRVE